MSTSPLVDQFANDIDDVINKYSDQGLTVAEAVGALDIAKMEIWYNHTDYKDDEKPWGAK